MNLSQSFIMAIKSLMGSKVRSLLTMLGIIIGVASVVILTSLMSGLQDYITEQVESFGSNLITVQIMGRGNTSRRVEPDDFQDMVDKNSEYINLISPNISMGGTTVKYGSENASTTVVGANEQYHTINNYKIASGRFLQFIDMEARENVCVIGSYVKQNLFPGANPIGQTLKINGTMFKVVGVLSEKQSSSRGGSDDRVIIPYTVAQRLFKNTNVISYTLNAVSKDTADAAIAKIKAYLDKIFPNTGGGTNNSYNVFNQADVLDTINQMTGMMQMVLVGIASISLLVGGIGIMNIMLVSVSERTREIGIRKSVGAKKLDIMTQFVVEAGTTSAIGGIIGIVLGTFASGFVGNLIGLPVTATPASMILAFSVSAGIGVIFGYLPANKASNLNPIDALRYE